MLHATADARFLAIGRFLVVRQRMTAVTFFANSWLQLELRDAREVGLPRVRAVRKNTSILDGLPRRPLFQKLVKVLRIHVVGRSYAKFTNEFEVSVRIIVN